MRGCEGIRVAYVHAVDGVRVDMRLGSHDGRNVSLGQRRAKINILESFAWLRIKKQRNIRRAHMELGRSPGAYSQREG